MTEKNEALSEYYNEYKTNQREKKKLTSTLPFRIDKIIEILKQHSLDHEN